MNEKWQIEDEEIANDISAKNRHFEEEDRKLALQLEKEMNADSVISDSKVIVTRNKLKKDKENIPPSEASLTSSETCLITRSEIPILVSWPFSP